MSFFAASNSVTVWPDFVLLHPICGLVLVVLADATASCPTSILSDAVALSHTIVVAVPLAIPPAVNWLVEHARPRRKFALLETAELFEPMALASIANHVGITSSPAGVPPGSSLVGSYPLTNPSSGSLKVSVALRRPTSVSGAAPTWPVIRSRSWLSCSKDTVGASASSATKSVSVVLGVPNADCIATHRL